MRFACPSCNQGLLSRPENAGMTVRCPACGQRVTVPSPEEVGPKFNFTPPPGQAAPPRQQQQEQGPDGSAIQESYLAHGAQWSDQANVPPLFSGAIGIGIGAIIIGVLMPFKGSYLADLFVDRGWVPYVLALFLGWSIGILILKAVQLKKQKTALIVDVLPTYISWEINQQNLPEFLQHIANIPEDLRNSFMVRRVRRALEHFRVRGSTPEVASMNTSQSDIELSGIVSSYTLVKAFLWAIPILGFIGTVIGISAAITNFSVSTDAAGEMAKLKESIQGVTGGLAVAFDTTLLALCLSIILYFPMSALQKGEEDLLNNIDEYCNENLLKRLNDGGQFASATGGAPENVLNEIRQVQESMAATYQQQIELYGRTSAAIEQSLAATQSEAVQANAVAAKEQFEQLGQAVAALNNVLVDLGERKLVIQQVKRGWFGGKVNLTKNDS